MIRTNAVQQMKALADTLGANSTAALIFDDPRVAEEVLSSLRLEPSVVQACTYDTDGNVFAQYRRANHEVSDSMPELTVQLKQEGHAFVADGHLDTLRPFLHDGKQLGSIYIRSSLDGVREKLNRSIAMVAIVLLLCFCASVGMSSLLQRIVAAPIVRLAQAMKKVSNSGDYSCRVAKHSNDELGVLCTGFNEMLEQIEKHNFELNELHQTLLETARQAGQAEVATSVLHNVGNVLNSLNVSTSLLEQHIRKSRITAVANTAELLRQHADDLPSFFTDDDRGRRLPGFIEKLAKQLAAEQETALSEIQNLDENVRHINQIIKAQQSYARLSDVFESCRLDDILDEAERIVEISAERHGIRIVREHADLPPVEVPKSKILQVLVNLIVNAKDALLASDTEDKTLTLRTDRCNDERVCVIVQDNGKGIPKDELTRIFSYGFTTKPRGHGFGLHSAAIAIASINGSLRALSDGPGRGATFVLEIPIQEEAITV